MCTKFGAEEFANEWSDWLSERKLSISSDDLKDWIVEWSRKGPVAIKQMWETFLKAHVESLMTSTKTTTQTCEIVLKSDNKKELIETVVVWNGNGIRARWNGKNELKEIVRATDPDLLCFQEAKSDVESILKLENFERWISEVGFRYLYCYWSEQEGKRAHGNEGMLLFSKVQCEKITYGMGHEDFDKQARVITAEFKDFVQIFTYNPQGGFFTESLEYRARWETVLGVYLERIYRQAKQRGKKVIWAGDFNVNPYRTDWCEESFDRIRHKMPKGTIPVGCRAEDQAMYRKLVDKIDGVNVAEAFGKQDLRTCFQTEHQWKRNIGQRIDHVIAEKSMLEEKGLHLKAYETLQQFGGARKGCSDHCPLWYKLERKSSSEQVTMAMEVQTLDENDLDPVVLNKIANLGKDPPMKIQSSEEQIEQELEDEEDSEFLPLWEDSDEEMDDWLLNVEKKPFEDCVMPILRCEIAVAEKLISARMLIDSGSSIDIISRQVAKKLEKNGCVAEESEDGVNITVANGTNCHLKHVMKIKLKFGSQLAEQMPFLIMDDLPCDIIPSN